MFINDILVYFKRKKEHEAHLGTIQKLLKEKQLYNMYSVQILDFFSFFLGNMVSKEGVMMDLQKVKAMKKWVR